MLHFQLLLSYILVCMISNSIGGGITALGERFNDLDFLGAVDKHNHEAMEILTQLVDDTASSATEWKCVGEKSGVKVERRYIGAGPFVSPEDAAKGAKHACVKSSAVIDASPEAVFNLFADNSRVKEYNEHCVEIKDVHKFQESAGGGNQRWTKVAWASSPSYGPFKSRDFLSVVNYNRFANGTSIILNRPAYLAAHAPDGKHVRATVLLAGNIIRPYGNARPYNQTYLTMVAQINPGGGADTPAAAWIINKLCAAGPPDFIRKLETAAQKVIHAPKTASINHHSNVFARMTDHFEQRMTALREQVGRSHNKDAHSAIHRRLQVPNFIKAISSSSSSSSSGSSGGGGGGNGGAGMSFWRRKARRVEAGASYYMNVQPLQATEQMTRSILTPAKHRMQNLLFLTTGTGGGSRY